MEDAKDSVADKDSLSQLTSTNKNETVKDDNILFSKPIEVGTDATWNVTRDVEREKLREPRHCQQHAKKVMKHALRQQAKRRRKNTTIAAGNSAPSQRLTLSPSARDIEDVSCDTACYRQPTMAEVLASIPGWSVKPRKSSRGKKLSAAAQLDQAKEGTVDLESPDSILVNSNLRSLLNKHTFSSLPPLYQYKLLQLLPHVDRTGSDSVFRLSGSGLNNEFFARACLDWRERLAEGEFTLENQAKIKAEQEKEKSKLDPWKLKHFEPTWGESLREWPTMPVGAAVAVAVAPTATPTPTPAAVATAPRTKATPAPPSAAPGPPTSQRKEPIVTRVRTVGAVTRAVANYREKRAALSPPPALEPKRNRQEPSKLPEKVTNHIEQDDIKMEAGIVTVEKREEVVSGIMDGVEEAKEPDVSSDVKVSVVKPELNGPMTESEMNGPTADSEVNASIFDPVVKDSDPTADCEVTISIAESEVNTTVDESEMNVPITDSQVNAPVADSEENGSSPEEDVNTSIFDPVVKDSVSDTEVMETLDEPQRTESVVESQVSESIVDMEVKVSIDGSEENESAVTEEIVVYSDVQQPIDESELKESMVESAAHAHSGFAESRVESDVKEPVFDPEMKEFISLENDVSKAEEICENSIDIDSDFDKQEESQESVSLTTFRDDVQCEAENELSSGFTSAVEESESIVEEKQTFVEMPFPSEEKEMKFEIVDSMVEEALILEEANESPPILPPPTPFLGEDEQQSMDDMEMGGGDPLGLAEEVVGPTYGEKGMLGDRLELVRSEDGLRNEIRLRSGVVGGGDGGGEKWEVIQVDPREKGGAGLYEGLKEDEAAILAAAWDVVSTPSHFQDLQQPVSVIPCQEELEVRLQESSLPAPQWIDYSAPAHTGTKQGPGHVKLELEVTLTPEVDSQVTSSSSSSSSGSAAEAPVRVIPPTTIVCLPPLAAPPPPPPPPASTSALPYLALTTSTPVRALPTKPLQTKSGIGGIGGRGGRGSNSSKPPPGAVNLERSYQICQAVIQNSPNRHQLRCQLKPPPSLLVPAPPPPRPRPRPTRTVLLRHVFTSTAGIPVSMAVLPSHHPHVRRSNSAPPSHPGPGTALHCAGAGGGGRPASVACVIGTGSCSCSLRPLVPCRRCGDFCHEDCITPSRLCVTCHSA